MKRLPRLAIVSTGIRRDLVAPLKYFTRFEIIHFYRHAEYGDLDASDLDGTLRQYHSPYDLYHQLVDSRPDVIQGVEPFSVALQPYLWACYFAALVARASLNAVTLENRPLESKFNRAAAILLQNLVHIYFRRACLVVVLNEGARRNANRSGVEPAKMQNLMWGTWGVDLNEFSPATASANHPPTVLFAGRLHRQKGVMILLDAFARVRTRIPDPRLVLVGDGPARREVEERIETMSGVIMRGAVKNRLMPEVFRSADVLAMPSLTTRKWEEQVGMVALQAMACGVPVVATRSGAIPEYVPEGIGGLLVPEGDADALAQALIKVLSNPQFRNQLAQGARAFACEHYDAAKNIAVAEQALIEHCFSGTLGGINGRAGGYD